MAIVVKHNNNVGDHLVIIVIFILESMGCEGDDVLKNESNCIGAWHADNSSLMAFERLWCCSVCHHREAQAEMDLL